MQLDTVLASGLWSTLVDPSQLENALLDLCINARGAMPNGGKITIETGRLRCRLIGNRSKPINQETGLSLFMIYELAKQSGA